MIKYLHIYNFLEVIRICSFPRLYFSKLLFITQQDGNINSQKTTVSDISRYVLIRLIPRSNLCTYYFHTHNVETYKILTLRKTSHINRHGWLCLKNCAKSQKGLLWVKIEIWKKQISCVLWHRLIIFCCFDSALNPDWGRAYLGCDLRRKVVCFRKLSFVVPWKFLKMLEE